MSLLFKKVLNKLKKLDNLKADKINITTDYEFKTGRIIDGKEEYSKKFIISALPSTSTYLAIETRLSNINYVNLEGSITGENIFSNLPFIEWGTMKNVSHYFDSSSNKIAIRVGGDMSMYGATEILYYTKN